MAYELFDGFEDNDLSEWSNVAIATDSTAWSGNYSAYGSKPNNTTTYVMMERSFGMAVVKVRLYYREKDTSQGGGYQFYDDGGNRVAGVCTANPEWAYTDGSSDVQLYTGSNYWDWHEVELTFDDDAGTYDIRWENLSSGTVRTATANMDAVGEVSYIKHVNVHDGTDLVAERVAEDGNSGIEHWTDHIEIEAAVPDAPTDVSATANGADQIDLSWTDNSDAEDGFHIDRYNGSWGRIADVGADTTQYTDSGLLDGEEYRYRVRAYNDAGSSDWSDSDFATTELPAPSGVSQIIESPTSIVVSWTDNSDNENQFRVQVNPDGAGWATEATVGSDMTSVTGGVSRSADEVRWRVRAETDAANSDWAYSETVSTNGSGLTATTVDNDRIDLSWDAKQDADEYNIYRAQSAGSSLSDYSFHVSTTGTSITDTGLEDGTEYHYRVAPVYGGEEDVETDDAAATTDLPAPTWTSIDNSTEDELALDWTRNDTSADGGWAVYRSTDGSSGAKVASLSDQTQTTFTDTGLDDGEKYYYTVERDTGDATSTTAQQAATTILPAPTGLAETDHGDTTISIAWTDEHDNGSTRVQYKPTDVSSWTSYGDFALGAESATIDGLRTGEEYDVRVLAVTKHTETETTQGPIQATTDLPSPGSFDSLDNGVEDEVTAHWPDVINYGDYRVQWRDADDSAWTDWGTVGQDTTSATVTGLDDGREYEFRVRSQTEHDESSWATGSIITKFPTPTTPTATLSSTNPKTTVELSFEDHADSEDGVRVLRQREYDSRWGPLQEVADLGPNAGTGTVTTVDDTASPGNTYRYAFEAYTDDSAHQSDTTSTVTTDSSGRPRTQTGAGWTVEIDHPDADAPLRPQLLDDPETQPRVNDLPRIRIPVPRDENWTREAFEDASMRVWKDGERKPIDTLIGVTMQPDQTILHGRGGRELKQSVDAEYQLEDVHVAVEDLITTNTPYQADVDAPEASYRQDVAQKTIDSASDWETDLASSIASDDPWTVTSDGYLQRTQTSWLLEGETASSPEGTVEHEDYSEFTALNLNALLEFGPWEFTTDHAILSGECVIALRIDTDGGNPAFDVFLDGNYIGGANADAFAAGLTWFDMTAGFEVGAGTHQVTVEVTEFGSGGQDSALLLDVVNAHDGRFYDNSDLAGDNLGTGGPLPGPEDYSVGTRELSDAMPGQQVVGGRVDAVVNDTSGGQALAISNDQGQTWIEAENASTVEGSFAEASSRIRARFTLGGYGERTNATDPSPAYGFKPQAVDLYELYADLDETPAVINQSVDDHLDRVLRDLAEQGGFVWEYRLVDGQPTVVWTQPGQRVTETDLDLADYDVRKRAGRVYESVTVVGGPQSVRNEGFTAATGEAYNIKNEYLVDGSETVYHYETSKNYERGVDYEISYLDGTVTPLSTGEISDGDPLEIDYRFETRGSYALDSVDTPREAPKQPIPGLTSSQACEQAAATIVNEVSEPLWEVGVTLPPGEVGFAVVDALDVPDLPVDEPWTAKQVSNSPQEIRVEGGSRQSVDEVVRQIRERVDQVSRRS